MKPHEQRVIDEKNELADRLAKLTTFIASNPLFCSLPYDEQGRMKIQRFIMGEYKAVLEDRIDNFPTETILESA